MSRSGLGASERLAIFRSLIGLQSSRVSSACSPQRPGLSGRPRSAVSMSRSGLGASERLAFSRSLIGLPSPRPSSACSPQRRGLPGRPRSAVSMSRSGLGASERLQLAGWASWTRTRRSHDAPADDSQLCSATTAASPLCSGASMPPRLRLGALRLPSVIPSPANDSSIR